MAENGCKLQKNGLNSCSTEMPCAGAKQWAMRRNDLR